MTSLITALLSSNKLYHNKKKVTVNARELVDVEVVVNKMRALFELPHFRKNLQQSGTFQNNSRVQQNIADHHIF